MVQESTPSNSSVVQESVSRGELPSRSDLEAAANVKREKIKSGLVALREEIRHIPVREFIRDHPIKTTAGAAVIGFGVTRWALSRLGWGELSPEEYRRQLVDELLEAIIDDAAFAVSNGASPQEALRTAFRAHSPIVFEVEREPEEEAESVAATVVHTLFALAQPYLQQYLRGQLSSARL